MRRWCSGYPWGRKSFGGARGRCLSTEAFNIAGCTSMMIISNDAHGAVGPVVPNNPTVNDLISTLKWMIESYGSIVE
jgi:hypothetical protein